jgi:hypothetical protein
LLHIHKTLKSNPLIREKARRDLNGFQILILKLHLKRHPTIIHHAKRLAVKGYHHLIVAAVWRELKSTMIYYTNTGIRRI